MLSATALPPLSFDPWEDARVFWQGVMDGQWSVEESFGVGDRRVLIIRRSADSSDSRGLSSNESRVLARTAEGHTDKLIAYHLGVAEGTVSAYLCRALRKLKISGRIELVRQLGSRCSSDLACGKQDALATTTVPMPVGTRARHLGADLVIIDFPVPGVTMPAELTDAEQEVALLVSEGATDEQIARARRASVKTVSNQVGSIFRKLDLCSRVELVLYLQRVPSESN